MYGSNTAQKGEYTRAMLIIKEDWAVVGAAD
jgi:hypothetical protein